MDKTWQKKPSNEEAFDRLVKKYGYNGAMNFLQTPYVVSNCSNNDSKKE